MIKSRADQLLQRDRSWLMRTALLKTHSEAITSDTPENTRQKHLANRALKMIKSSNNDSPRSPSNWAPSSASPQKRR